MRTLVTGANGFIGAQLCRALVARGDAVRVLVRPRSNLKLLEGVEAEQALGDVTDAASVEAAVRGVDVVYHLAGIRRTPHPEDFHTINVEGTRHVLEAAARQTNPPRVVLAGSLSATGPSEDKPLTEEDPLRPVEAYGRSKQAAEQVCAEFKGRVPVAIGRPPRVLGPGDRENLAFVKIVQKGLLLRLTGPARHLSMIDVDDVVAGFVTLGTHPAAAGETFFLTAPDTLTLTRLQEVAAQTLGRTIRMQIPVAPWGLRGSAWAADHISKLTGRHLPLNHKLAEQLLARGWWCSGAKAERLLGFRAQHGLEESVARSVRWYQEQGWI